MAGARNHDYHILEPSIWPLIGSVSALVSFFGLTRYMHDLPGGHAILGLGIAGLILTFYSWWSAVVREAQAGDHTPVVQLHLRYGMILFIISEVMFFVGWFWAWFDFSMFPAPIEVVREAAAAGAGATDSVTSLFGQEGAEALLQWPPKGIEVISAYTFPLLNTMILLCSGTTITWAHHSLINGDRDGLIKGLWLTIILGLVFSGIQVYEYAHAPFDFGKSNYSSAFYMATGFHGFHVVVGTIFLIVCLVRAYKGHFTPKQHFGFEAAAWYWHFVDVVWLFLFIVVYVWGGWGAPVHG